MPTWMSHFTISHRAGLTKVCEALDEFNSEATHHNVTGRKTETGGGGPSGRAQICARRFPAAELVVWRDTAMAGINSPIVGAITISIFRYSCITLGIPTSH